VLKRLRGDTSTTPVAESLRVTRTPA
jgi:hypothetical protein